MECTILVEVGEETLQDHIQERTALGEKQNRNKQPLTDRQEIGNRARAIRIAMFNYIANSQVRNALKRHQERNKITT